MDPLPVFHSRVRCRTKATWFGLAGSVLVQRVFIPIMRKNDYIIEKKKHENNNGLSIEPARDGLKVYRLFTFDREMFACLIWLCISEGSLLLRHMLERKFFFPLYVFTFLYIIILRTLFKAVNASLVLTLLFSFHNEPTAKTRSIRFN